MYTFKTPKLCQLCLHLCLRRLTYKHSIIITIIIIIIIMHMFIHYPPTPQHCFGSLAGRFFLGSLMFISVRFSCTCAASHGQFPRAFFGLSSIFVISSRRSERSCHLNQLWRLRNRINGLLNVDSMYNYNVYVYKITVCICT